MNIEGFSTIIGHDKQLSYLENMMKNKNSTGVFCFYGPHYVGKTAVMNYFLASVLGVKINALEYQPNILYIKRLFDEKNNKYKKNISVEQVRNLCSRLSMSSFGNTTKIAIIEDADLMSINAQNALLKTIEEPQGETLIILLTKNLKGLLPTIKSRTINLRFEKINRSKIKERLLQKTDEQTAELISDLSFGLPGNAIKMLDQKFRDDYLLQVKNAIEWFSLGFVERLGQLLNYAKVGVSDKELDFQFEIWRQIVHDLLYLSVGMDEHIVFKVYQENLTKIAQKNDVFVWYKVLNEINNSQQNIKNNLNRSLSLEQFNLTF